MINLSSFLFRCFYFAPRTKIVTAFFAIALLFSSSVYAILPQQVMIEVKVVEINYDAAVSSGISWGLNANNPNQLISSITASFPRTDSSAGGVSLTFGALSSFGINYGFLQGTLDRKSVV